MRRFNVTKNGYRFDRRIFWGGMLIVFILVLYLFSLNNFDFKTRAYFNCRQDYCENPMYHITDCKERLNILWVIPLYTAKDCREGCEWCKQEYLPKGEYGEKPSQLYKLMYPLTFVLIAMMLGINHLLYNKGKKFDVEIPFSKKHKLNIRDFLKKR